MEHCAALEVGVHEDCLDVIFIHFVDDVAAQIKQRLADGGATMFKEWDWVSNRGQVYAS